MNNKENQKKPKNDIVQMNEIFEKFRKHIENMESVEIDYDEIYRKNEMIKHFNKRILECNKVCIKYPEINRILYEEQKCLTSCQKKISEVSGAVAKYLEELKVGKFDSPYLNPDLNL